MQSCLYEGRLRHRRFSPTENTFDHRLFMVYIDLDELGSAFDHHPLWSSRGPNVASFTRADHLGGPDTPLDVSVRDHVDREAGFRPAGPIRLLTHFRYLGHRFNPVSFFYCFDQSEQLQAIVAEINNTPWGEQYPYVLTDQMNQGTADRPRYEFSKAFHVSPFMPMKQDYVWQFTSPGDSLSVNMDNVENGRKCFDATMTMKRRELTRAALTRVLVAYPVMTVSIVASIYWQAARLWWKNTPFYDKPLSAPVEPERTSNEVPV